MNLHIFKRHIGVLLFFSLLFLLLVGRLAYIQLIGTEHFSSHGVNLIKKSVQQRQQQMILHSGRGEITDRHGQNFTGTSTHVLVIFPISNKVHLDMKNLEQVATLVNISYERIAQEIEVVKEPQIYRTSQGILQLSEVQANQVNKLNIPGILGLPYELRYEPDQVLAQHFIGYMGQNPQWIRSQFAEELAQGTLTENSEIGISGIERTFQPFLQGVGPTSLSYYVDGKGNPLKGMEIKYAEQGNPFYPLIVQTTLDKEMQRELEKIVHERVIQEGAAIVLDAETSEILATVSRPNFTQHMSAAGAWENKVLKRYTPGSIFKIVIAAAALENEIVKPNQRFQCDGVLEGTNFHCWKEEGHGEITFEEGFAQSCNIVFGQLAQDLGPDLIEEFAYKLGVLQQNGWQNERLFHLNEFKQLDREEVGQVFASSRSRDEKEDELYLLRTGIGQLDVQLTPISIANMLATINKGGKKHEVKGVRDILYHTGSSFYHFDTHSMEGPTISPFTAYQLQRLMAGVVEKGTALSLKNKPWTASGKTGTAQVSMGSSGNQYSQGYMKNHRWFAGYYPRHNPRFVIVAVTLNQDPQARNLPIDIFAEMVEWLDQNR